MYHPPLRLIALVSTLALTTVACDMPPPETEDNCAEVEVVPEQVEVPSVEDEGHPVTNKLSVSTPVGPDYDAGHEGVTGTYMQITRRIVRAHLSEIRHCYDLGLKQDPALAGRIVVTFTISADGSVQAAEVASSDLSNETVSECVIARVQRWKFAKPRHGSAVVVNYPFILETDGHAPTVEAPPLVPSPKTEVTGDEEDLAAMPKKTIRRIVRAHINEIRHCYNEGLHRDPELAGRVVVNFKVGGDGKVAESTVAQTNLGDSDVETCMAHAVGRWKFPKTASGNSLVVNYPFVLEPG